ncbi:MAG: O-antigen ligase family protein [bacterium]
MFWLILIYLIIFAYLALRRLDLALMIIIFALWSYLIRVEVLGFPTTLLELMILIVFAVWIIKNLPILWKRVKANVKKRKITNRYPFDWEIILLLIISLVAVSIAGWNNSALGAWKAYFFEPILLFLIIFNVLNKEYSKIVYPLAFSAAILSAIAIFQKLTGIFIVPDFWNELGHRATSVFQYPNALGLCLAPIIMILIGWLFYELKKKNKLKIVFLIITIILSIIAVYCAESEGALVAIGAALIVFGILANKKIAVIIIIILSIAGTLIYLNQPVYEKVKDKVTLFDLSGQIRRQQWKETWTMLKDNRIIAGSGLSNYKTAIEPYHQEGIFVKNHDPKWLEKVLTDPVYHKNAWQPTEIYIYPHNIVLNFWTELGLAGALIFIFIIIKYLIIALKNCNKSNKYFALGLLGAMITIIVHGIVDVPYFKNDLSILFWLLIALLGMLNANKKIA